MAAISSVASATIPDSSGVYWGCYAKSGGTVSLIDYPTQRCANTQTLVSWSQKGPQGPTGPAGVPGATGPQGPQGYSASVSAPDPVTGCYAITIVDPLGVQVPGSQVATVCNGAQGPAGPIGATGPKGDPGSPGATGATGPQGIPGSPGQSVQVAAEPAGPNCASGGARITDAAGNVAFVCSATAAATTAVYGYPDQFTGTTTFGANYLLGTAIDVPATTLLRFGLIAPASSAGIRFKMALYSDLGGKPNVLVASTPATSIAGGRQEITVPATAVAAGRYWLTAVYETSAPGYRDSRAGAPVTTSYVPFSFPDALPATFPSPYQYLDGPFNYFIVGAN